MSLSKKNISPVIQKSNFLDSQHQYFIHLFSFLRSRFPEVKELFTGNPLSLETAFLSSIGSGITFLSFAIFFPVFANDIQDPIEELKDIILLTFPKQETGD